jgi:hypothetical protein
VSRRPVGADHARGDVLDTPRLDPPRRPLPNRVGIEEQRDHHRRIVRRPTKSVDAIDRRERRQIHRRDSVDHKPRQMVLRQPLTQARRQQELPLAVAHDEVRRHAEIVLTGADGTPIYATATMRWVGDGGLLLLVRSGRAADRDSGARIWA